MGMDGVLLASCDDRFERSSPCDGDNNDGSHDGDDGGNIDSKIDGVI